MYFQTDNNWHSPIKDRINTTSTRGGLLLSQSCLVCNLIFVQLTELKQGLKDALYSQKWTPDAYLLAKAIVNDPTDADSRPLSADE